MKIVSTNPDKLYHCQNCHVILEYEDADMQYFNGEWEKVNNTDKLVRTRISYLECPICHSHFNFDSFTEWKEE